MEYMFVPLSSLGG